MMNGTKLLVILIVCAFFLNNRLVSVSHAATGLHNTVYSSFHPCILKSAVEVAMAIMTAHN